MSHYAYLRVSTGSRSGIETDKSKRKQQSTERQEVELLKYAQENKIIFDRVFQDYSTGKKFDRPEYQEMKALVKSGDTIYVHELSRFGRNWSMIKDEWKYLMDHDINIIVTTMPLLNSSAGEQNISDRLVKNIVFEIFCFLAQQKIEEVSRSTIEGLRLVRAKGQVLGRPDVYSDKIVAKAIKEYENRSKGETLATISAKYGFSAPTLYNRIQRKKKGEN